MLCCCLVSICYVCWLLIVVDRCMLLLSCAVVWFVYCFVDCEMFVYCCFGHIVVGCFWLYSRLLLFVCIYTTHNTTT